MLRSLKLCETFLEEISGSRFNVAQIVGAIYSQYLEWRGGIQSDQAEVVRKVERSNVNQFARVKFADPRTDPLFAVSRMSTGSARNYVS